MRRGKMWESRYLMQVEERQDIDTAYNRAYLASVLRRTSDILGTINSI